MSGDEPGADAFECDGSIFDVRTKMEVPFTTCARAQINIFCELTIGAFWLKMSPFCVRGKQLKEGRTQFVRRS